MDGPAAAPEDTLPGREPCRRERAAQRCGGQRRAGVRCTPSTHWQLPASTSMPPCSRWSGSFVSPGGRRAGSARGCPRHLQAGGARALRPPDPPRRLLVACRRVDPPETLAGRRACRRWPGRRRRPEGAGRRRGLHVAEPGALVPGSSTHGDRFDLDQLVTVAEPFHAQQRARRACSTNRGFTHHVPDHQQRRLITTTYTVVLTTCSGSAPASRSATSKLSSTWLACARWSPGPTKSPAALSGTAPPSTRW
jgi:hypothetical protein